MMLKQDKQEREAFWKAMEDQAGEPIVHQALIRVIGASSEDLKDTWLLFFCGKERLYYKRFPAESLMSRLMTTAVKREEFALEAMAWERVSCRFTPPRGIFSKIFKSPGRLELAWGEERTFALELDERYLPLFEQGLFRGGAGAEADGEASSDESGDLPG